MPRSQNELVRLGAVAAQRGMSMVKVTRMFANERDKPSLTERAEFLAGFLGAKQPLTQVQLVERQLEDFVNSRS